MAIWNVDWLNANSQRDYPLADSSSLKDTSGAITLPRDFLVDLVLSVPVIEGVEPGLFHLQQLAVLPQGVMVTLGYDGTPIAAASVDRTTHQRYMSYRMVGRGDFEDAYGTITVGQFDNMDQVPSGLYTFDTAGGRVEATTIHPDIRGVTSIRVVNQRNVSDPLVGDVYLVAGRNARLQVSGNQITIDALPLSEELAEECGCDDPTRSGEPIRRINGVGPNEDGDFTLVGNDCLEFEPEPADNLLRISDKCCEPCCGPEELAVVHTDLAILQTDAATIQGQMIRLESVMNQLSNAILVSKTGSGSGC